MPSVPKKFYHNKPTSSIVAVCSPNSTTRCWVKQIWLSNVGPVDLDFSIWQFGTGGSLYKDIITAYTSRVYDINIMVNPSGFLYISNDTAGSIFNLAYAVYGVEYT